MMLFNDPAALAAFAEAHRRLQQLEAAGFAPELVREIQQEKLALLWDRAAEAPFYRDAPGVADRDLGAVEPTAKDRLKAGPADFARAGLERVVKYYESSGSSGIPTPTPRLAEDVIHNVIGVAPLWRRALGADPRRVAVLLPSDVVPVADFVAGVCEYLGHAALRCYPFTTGMCDFDRLERLFGGYRPEVLFAAPGVLTQWTRVLKSRGALDDVRSRVRTVMLLGEVSLPAQRAKLAADWQADVFDASYGSTETGTIAATCERDRLHLLPHGHILELRDGDKLVPAAPGATGELVDTPLNNFARPLLRLATGDIADVAAEPCPCGLALPTVHIHGRQSDRVEIGGTVVDERLIGSIVYQDHRVTGYLIQVQAAATRLVLERDVDVEESDDVLAADARERFEGTGIRWDDVLVVSQLPAVTKAGGSQKNWKRTNVVVAR
ncbi:phenylacetate--CoA ligase family protein [Kitasatospora sp. NBC_00070]|uniref:phenylacetate--CoA ligase family protein n=1 Tax=Kitasatospora sp. NBC_00070 TaxID=2975962 RepID=UPI00324D3FE3